MSLLQHLSSLLGFRRRALRKILLDASDFNVCNEAFLLLSPSNDGPLNVAGCDKLKRTILLVWNAKGILGNGGFQYLLEGDIPGDSDFRHTAKAFRTIGCETAADAFERVLAIFPEGRLPKDIALRLARFRESFGGFPNPIDDQFWNASKEIEKSLANYARAHGEELAKLV